MPVTVDFLQGSCGRLLTVQHAPPAGEEWEGQAIFVAPFGEEMNKSRRMYALTARRLARSGIASTLIDLFGTGDSEGEFADARWEIWQSDVGAAVDDARKRANVPIYLVGLRVGALLALDVARQAKGVISRVVLWQPVISGEMVVTHLLRMKVAAGMLGGSGVQRTTGEYLRLLEIGRGLEIGGYWVAPELAAAIRSLRIEDLAESAGTPLSWFDVSPKTDSGMSPANARMVELIRKNGVEVDSGVVEGSPFWSTVEIETANHLIDATCRALTSGGARV